MEAWSHPTGCLPSLQQASHLPPKKDKGQSLNSHFLLSTTVVHTWTPQACSLCPRLSRLDKQTFLSLLKHPQLFTSRTSSVPGAWPQPLSSTIYLELLMGIYLPGQAQLPSSNLLAFQLWSCQHPAPSSFSSECLCSSPLPLVSLWKLLLGYMILFVSKTVRVLLGKLSSAVRSHIFPGRSTSPAWNA